MSLGKAVYVAFCQRCQMKLAWAGVDTATIILIATVENPKTSVIHAAVVVKYLLLLICETLLLNCNALCICFHSRLIFVTITLCESLFMWRFILSTCVSCFSPVPVHWSFSWDGPVQHTFC